jgi:hypothetical protein
MCGTLIVDAMRTHDFFRYLDCTDKFMILMASWCVNSSAD